MEPSRAFCQGLVSSLRTGLVGVDADGRLAALSPEGARILGCPWDPSGLGKPCREVLAGQPELVSLLESALDGRPRAGRAETRLRGAPGREPLTIGYTLLPVRDGAGQVSGAAMLFRDLTPFERRDEQDRQRDRLAALGQMAAGLAHELRNPLASVEVLAGLLKRRLSHSEDADLVEELLAEIRAVGEAVTVSLEYVRPVVPALESVDARALLEDVCARALRRVTFAGEVRLHVSPDAMPLVADPALLRRALVDLAVNALQAMDELAREGGHALSLSAAKEPEGGAVFEVADTGPGVPAELRERIFHPFFTTRPEGTGVGLAEAQKVAAAHGGSLDVIEADGGGARFRIHLPSLPRDARPEDPLA